MNKFKYVKCKIDTINDLIKIIEINLDILFHNYSLMYSNEDIILLQNNYYKQLEELYISNMVPIDKINFLQYSKFIKYNDNIVGYFTVYDRYNKYNIYEYAYIDDIKIMSAYQKNGIGSHIMKFIIDNYNEIIVLDVNKLNTVAINMYKKFGFEILKEEYVDQYNEYRFVMYKLCSNILLNDNPTINQQILETIKNKQIIDL